MDDIDGKMLPEIDFYVTKFDEDFRFLNWL